MISQHWFQAMTWANIDPDLSRHMVPLGHNELKPGVVWQYTSHKWVILASGNSLLPVWCQAITWTNTESLLVDWTHTKNF